MTGRTAGRIAWTLWVIAAVAIAVAGVLSAQYPFSSAQEVHDPVGEAVWAASWLGFGLVGALVVRRRPDNRIGWLLVGLTLLLAIGVFSPGYGRVAYQNPGADLPLGALATWLAMWAIAPVFGGVIALLLLYPTGALTSRRQRVLGWLLASVLAVQVLLDAFTPGSPEGDAPPFNPLGVASLEEFFDVASGIIGSIFGLVAAATLVDFVYRFWRSKGVHRQQFKWLALAAAAFPPLFAAGILVEEFYLTPDHFDPVIAVFFLCGNGIAAAIGVAITRHGLYEINRVVSRTVAYAVLTAVLVGVYLAAVTLLTAVTAPVTEESPLAVAAATLLAAAVFGPARRRIQTTVDRRFNRGRYDAEVTVWAYRGRLRDEVDLATVAQDLLATVTATMQPAGATLWIARGTNLPEKNLPSSTAVTVPERPRETKGT